MKKVNRHVISKWPPCSRNTALDPSPPRHFLGTPLALDNSKLSARTGKEIALVWTEYVKKKSDSRTFDQTDGSSSTKPGSIKRPPFLWNGVLAVALLRQILLAQARWRNMFHKRASGSCQERQARDAGLLLCVSGRTVYRTLQPSK